MAFPLVRVGPKPLRGQRVLDKEAADAKALTHEIDVKKAVRARDIRCRWPEKHKCRLGYECAHVLDASLGGEMVVENLILVCAWIHRRGPESIHGKQLRVDVDAIHPVYGPLFTFWKQDEAGVYYLIARETAPFVFERD